MIKEPCYGVVQCLYSGWGGTVVSPGCEVSQLGVTHWGDLWWCEGVSGRGNMATLHTMLGGSPSLPAEIQARPSLDRNNK